MFTKAIEWDKAVINPVKKVKLFKEDNLNYRFLSEEESKKLIYSANGYIRDIIIMALNTGMRLGEILSLQWENVDLGLRMITIKESKNQTFRSVPINDSLYSTLVENKDKVRGPFIFCNQKGNPFKRITKGFKAAIRRSGIEDCRFHDLRHTFASHLVMNGADLITIKELLGHKTITMTLRYAHLSNRHKKKVLSALRFGEDLSGSTISDTVDIQKRSN
jgi:integrase